jgi:putative flippase GtrA
MNKVNFTGQFIKFSFVGVINTIITLLTIWIFVNIFSSSHYLANIAGYVFGVLNSYFFNKIWTFSNKSKVSVTLVKFVVVFGISYLIQLGMLYILINYTSIEPFICQILSMIFYTIINFTLNKKVTFKTDIK